MDKLRVAIIGSGFGGLAAAIRLQAAGFETVIYEKRDLPGGRAYVYRDQGFTFDAGPTVITAPHCLEELFALAGERMADHVTPDPVRPPRLRGRVRRVGRRRVPALRRHGAGRPPAGAAARRSLGLRRRQPVREG